MPRLDGYGLLARQIEPAFKQLPIAMLTSRSGHKGSPTSNEFGRGYFPKPSQ